MKSTEKWARIILGVFLMIYALNKFLHIFPTSYGSMPEITRDFLDAVVIYLPYLYVFEFIIGALLVANKWTSLILIMLFPLSAAFLMFNFLNGDLIEGIPALFVAALNFLLILSKKEQYRTLLN